MKNSTFEQGLYSIRYTGFGPSERGVSIYDLGTSLLSLQRIVNKAHLSIDGKLKKGATPTKHDRSKLALAIGERRRSSDAFSLIPLLSDPTAIEFGKKVADYVFSAIVSYYIGNTLDKINKEPDERKQQFIGSIHADIVNIVNRIDAAGGVETIEIGSPINNKTSLVTFDSERKDYINSLSNQYYLGKLQKIIGYVYRLYPNSNIVSIRRSGGSKVNVFLVDTDFELIRYQTGTDPKVTFVGRPRFKFGIESVAISEFEATSIEINQQD